MIIYVIKVYLVKISSAHSVIGPLNTFCNLIANVFTKDVGFSVDLSIRVRTYANAVSEQSYRAGPQKPT